MEKFNISSIMIIGMDQIPDTNFIVRLRPGFIRELVDNFIM